MAAPKVYKSTDANAPVLSGILGSMIGLLDAVLVNGYGDKSPMGWTKEFSGSNKAVYRPSSGKRLFFKIDNSIALYGGITKFSVKAYESMSDIDTGLGLMGPRYVYASGTVNTAARDWIIVGDGYGIHLFVLPLFANWPGWEYNYFGDGIPILPSDAWFSIISGRPTGDNYAWSEMCLIKSHPYTNEAILAARRSSGDSATIGSTSSFRASGSARNDWLGQNNLSLTYPTDGLLLYTRPIIDDGAYTVRGFLPGLYAPEQYNGLTHGEIYTDGTKSLMAIKTIMGNENNYFGAVLIDIGAGYRP